MDRPFLVPFGLHIPSICSVDERLQFAYACLSIFIVVISGKYVKQFTQYDGRVNKANSDAIITSLSISESLFEVVPIIEKLFSVLFYRV